MFDRITTEIQRWIDRLWFRREKRSRFGEGVDPAVAIRAEEIAVDRVKKATHPNVSGFWGKLKHFFVWADDVYGRTPVVRGGIGGWYIQQRKEVYIVRHPTVGYVLEVWIHECAHYLEDMLRLVPPWHYPPWAGLFMNWRNVAVKIVPMIAKIFKREKNELLMDDLLPGCRVGDIVEVDAVDGQYTCRCTRRGMEIVE